MNIPDGNNTLDTVPGLPERDRCDEKDKERVIESRTAALFPRPVQVREVSYSGGLWPQSDTRTSRSSADETRRTHNAVFRCAEHLPTAVSPRTRT